MFTPSRPLLLLTLLLAASCGDDDTATQRNESQRPARHVSGFARQSVPDLGRLVPADAVALVVFAPRATLEPKLDAFFESVHAPRQPVLDQLLTLSGTAREDVDPGRPFGVALTLGEDNAPQPTFILPAKGGEYVAKGHAAPAADVAPPLARDLPGGDVAFRIDLARLVPAYRPMIEPYLSADGLVGLDPALSADPNALAMLDALARGAATMLDSAERLDGALGLDGGKVDLSLALQVKEGSALDGEPVRGGAPLLDLARSIDARRCAMTMLMRADFAAWMDALLPFLRATYGPLPDGEERLARYLAAYKAMYDAMGPSMVMGLDFDADGIRMAGAMKPDDPDAYLARYAEAVVVGSAPELGMTIEAAEPVEADGVPLHAYLVDIDWKRMLADTPAAPDVEELFRRMTNALFGRAGIRFAQAAVEDHVIMATPTPDGSYAAALATARERSGGVAPAVAAAVGDRTTLLVHVDLRRAFRGVSALLARFMPESGARPIPDGPPVDFWFRVDHRARTYTFALHADAGGAVAIR